MPKKTSKKTGKKNKSLLYYDCDLSYKPYENVEISGYAENEDEAKELMKKEITDYYTDIIGNPEEIPNRLEQLDKCFKNKITKQGIPLKKGMNVVHHFGE